MSVRNTKPSVEMSTHTFLGPMAFLVDFLRFPIFDKKDW